MAGDLGLFAGPDDGGLLMRILYLITKSEHGGAQSHLLHLVRTAAQRGTVLVLTGEDGQFSATLRSEGIETHALGHLKHRLHPWHDVAGLSELTRWIRLFDPDIVHAHSGKAGLLGRLAAASQHVPSVYTAHGFSFAEGTPFGRKCAALAGEWIAGQAGDFTIAVSRSESELAVRYHLARRKRRAVIYNGVDEPALRAVPQNGPPVIAMVARFDFPKQQALLIRAFSHIAGNARLWLIGDGPELPSAVRVAQRCGMRDRITFWGDRNDVIELLARAQVGALISSQEGFGLSLIEAMSLGLPVIASACGGMREIVCDGQNGLLVAAGDESQLAAALEQLVSDPQLRKRMGEAGLACFRENFTARAMVERTFHVYESLLGGARAPQSSDQALGRTYAVESGD